MTVPPNQPEVKKSENSSDNSPESTLTNEKPVQLQTLLVWQAPSRLFKARDKEFFSTLAAIAFLLGIILFFIKEWFAIITMGAMVFLAYVFSTIKPETVEYQITNRGLLIHGQTFYWEELSNFWFEEKYKQQVLYVDKLSGFPFRLVVPLGDLDINKVKKILSEYLVFEQPDKTWIENAGVWLSKKVPLEKEN